MRIGSHAMGVTLTALRLIRSSALLKAMAIGGRPANPRSATLHERAFIGRISFRPLIPLRSRVPREYVKLPAVRKASPLTKAWAVSWNMAAFKPTSRPRDAKVKPTNIIPASATVEYARSLLASFCTG